jgi:hypothetical protein
MDLFECDVVEVVALDEDASEKTAYGTMLVK